VTQSVDPEFKPQYWKKKKKKKEKILTLLLWTGPKKLNKDNNAASTW
jgi:hypothetical protein